MKYLILVTFLVFGSISMAADYESVRCDFKNDSMMEVVFGKFKKMQKDCCMKRLEQKEACDSREEYQKCKNGGKGIAYALNSGVECSDGCKLFREDCDDFISTVDVNSNL